MQESGWPNLTRNIMKGICQRSDVQDAITIPWSVLSKSPPKALSSLALQPGYLLACLMVALVDGLQMISFPTPSVPF
jgi:hypothetical protein